MKREREPSIEKYRFYFFPTHNQIRSPKYDYSLSSDAPKNLQCLFFLFFVIFEREAHNRSPDVSLL